MPYLAGHRAAARQEIIERARKLLNRYGFDNVSLVQIMAAAGLSHGVRHTGLARVMQSAEMSTGTSPISFISRDRESLEKTAALSRIFVRDGNRIVPVLLSALERIQGASLISNGAGGGFQIP